MKAMRRLWVIEVSLMIIVVIALAATVASAQQGKITIKVGHHHRVDSLAGELCEKFKELVVKNTAGRVDVQIYPGAQLGQETEAMEGVLMGSLQVTIFSPGFLMDQIDGFGVDVLPGLFIGFDKTNMMLNESPIGEELNEKLIKRGGRVLGWLNYGPRDLIFRKKEVKTMKDMEGLKMRSPEDPIRIAQYRALNTLPVPITWGEVYTAFQTGVADGFDAPLTSVLDMNFYEVTKYVLSTNHNYAIMAFVMNEKFFQGLPKDIQPIVIQAGRDATAFGNQRAAQIQANAVKLLEGKGMVFHDFSKEDRAKFNVAMATLIEKWAKDHRSTDFIKRIQEYFQSK